MTLTLTITRRAVVTGTATALAIGGAVVIGLSGNAAAPRAAAGTSSPYGSALAADSTALVSDAFPGITVVGVGKVTGTPDTLVLDLAVSKTAPDVSTAMTQLAGTMTAVQQSLTKNGVAAADLKTSGLGVNPNYDYSGNKQNLTGYNAVERLTVELRDIRSAGATISAATDAGGNSVQISGLSTDLQNDSTLLNSARDSAFAAAKTKAAQYAKDAGRTLGAVVRVEESTASTGPQQFGLPVLVKGDAASAAVPIQVGSTDLSVSITVVFAFV